MRNSAWIEPGLGVHDGSHQRRIETEALGRRCDFVDELIVSQRRQAPVHATNACAIAADVDCIRVETSVRLDVGQYRDAVLIDVTVDLGIGGRCAEHGNKQHQCCAQHRFRIPRSP